MTILVDCITQMTKRLDRSITARVATDGLILLGVQLDEAQSFFIGDLQQLLIADTPDEAYNLCSKYSPGCGVGGGSAGFASTTTTGGSGFVSGVTGSQLISSSAEVSRSSSSSSSSSFSSGAASRSLSATVAGGGAASASGSSRLDVNVSRERVYGSGSGSASTTGGRIITGQINRGSSQASGQTISSGGSSSVVLTGSQGEAGGRGQLGEIREDIYGGFKESSCESWFFTKIACFQMTIWIASRKS